jgi:hypothetical protein
VQDLSRLLADWPFEPDGITVRVITGEDGREKIQLRVDLGLLQMEIDGRPDGALIHRAASWLDYYEVQQQEHDGAHPDGPPFVLDSAACAEMLREGVQYYHRYLSFWHLRRFELCARDTARNLRLFAFVRKFARHDRDKLQFDQWRPYVTMMHTRSVAMPLVELQLLDAALPVIDAGISAIEDFLREYGQEERLESVRELSFLRRWRRELESQQNASSEQTENSAFDTDSEETAAIKESDPIVRLQAELEAAIEAERYEEAARLRDEIRQQQGFPPSSLPDSL